MQNFVFFVLVALCCFAVSKAIDYDCLNKYRTINAYEDISQVNVSCYLSQGVCNLLYAPPGTGCDTNAIPIGGVNPGETKTVFYEFKLGGALCTNYQIDVSYLRHTTLIQWPRATDTGKKFNKIIWNPLAKSMTYRITVSMLSEPAKLVYTTSLGETENLTLAPYTTKLLDQKINVFAAWVSIISNVSVILSYGDFNGADTYYNVWQPLSTDPVLVHAPQGYSVGYAQFDCDTNAYLATTEDLIIETASTSDSSCKASKMVSDIVGVITTYGEACTVSLAPNKSNVCVSANLYDAKAQNYLSKDMALPHAKLGSRLISNGLDTKATLLSANSIQCQAYASTGFEMVKFNPLQSTVKGKGYDGTTPSNLNAIERIECPAPVYFTLNGGSYSQNIASFAQISDDLWNDFFTTKACPPDPKQQPLVPTFIFPPINSSKLRPSVEETKSSTFSPAGAIIPPPAPSSSTSPRIFSGSMIVLSLGFIGTFITNNIY